MKSNNPQHCSVHIFVMSLHNPDYMWSITTQHDLWVFISQDNSKQFYEMVNNTFTM